MKYIIYLKEAILCLKANRLRSFLALLGLLIGTASVVALITIGFLAKQTIIEQFKNLGTQKLTVHLGGQNQDDLIKLNSLLNNNEVNIFNKNIIEQINPMLSMFKTTYYNDTKLNSYQLGITQSAQSSLKLKLKQGRYISDFDNMRYFAVIGHELAQEIEQENKTKLKIGSNINIDDTIFTIIGILEPWPVDPLFSYNINKTILLPLSTVQYLQNNFSVNELYIDVKDNVAPKEAENYLNSLLSKVAPNTKLQFSNAEQIFEQLEKQAKILTILLGTIGAISLLVGAIGVMNIMLVAVVERKTEIGLRMAIGATPGDIKLQFLTETICLTSIGGIIGTALGIFIPYVITLLADWQFYLPISSIILGLVVSLGVGMTAGFYPANKASKLLPVVCLNNN